MKRIFSRILLLFAIFIASLIFFMSGFDQYDASSTQAMSEATLPVLYMQVDGIRVNRMYGYRQEVNESTFRETLTPLYVDKSLTVEINSYGAEIISVSYQLSSLDDEELIENGRLQPESADGNMIAEFTLNSFVPIDSEYMLRFEVDIGEDEPIYYYTRLVQNSGQTLSYYLEYADMFYQNCLNGNITRDMRSMINTDSAYTNSSLHSVSLKSDIEQIGWSELNPTLVKKAVPSILEINETTVSIGMEYVISATDEDGNTEYYTVSEYYRMRYSQDEIILLDYERTATEFFDGSLPVLTEDGLDLGVTGRAVNYVSNSSGDVVVFSQAGELWQYDRSSNKVSCIFSFRGDSYTDERYENNSYDISISTVSDDGVTTFVVYGYMVAGDNEGRLGISVYRYYADTNTTLEEVFIPLEDGYQMMSQGLSLLSYVNETNQCFIYYDDSIYTILLSEEPQVTSVRSGLSSEMIAVSDSQTLMAWSEGEEEFHETISVFNLNTGDTITIEAQDGDYIKVLGFMGEDLIYGTAHASDCYTNSAGNDNFPMYCVSIVGEDGEKISEYESEGFYVIDVEIEDEIINLSRVTLDSSGRMVTAEDDQILYYSPEDEAAVNVSLTVSDRNGTHVELEFSVSGESANLLSMEAGYPAENTAVILEIDEMEYSLDHYFVYAHGGLYEICDEINEAIISAYENVGVVLNSAQQYAWERGNISTAATLDVSKIPQGLLSAPSDEATFAAAIGDGYEVWNLTGCTLESVLYQISNGYAVVGQWSATESVLIVGYDIYDNIWLYDEDTQEIYAVYGTEAEAAFNEYGNIFLSYSEAAADS